MGHIHELYDFTASAFIVHEGKVLLLHHKKLKTWLQPGGHVELNEDPEMALWREIKEETGLTKKVLTIIQLQSHKLPSHGSSSQKRLPLPFDLNVHLFSNETGHKHIDFCYLMKSSTDKIAQNLTESNDLRWFSRSEIEEIANQLIPDIYSRALFALNMVV